MKLDSLNKIMKASIAVAVLAGISQEKQAALQFDQKQSQTQKEVPPDADEIICPISGDKMKVPVVAEADGHSYENEKILEWYELNGTIRNGKEGRGFYVKSPMTGVETRKGKLIRNLALEVYIKELSIEQDTQAQPKQFFCPLSNQIMTEEIVIQENGHSYDKTAFMQSKLFEKQPYHKEEENLVLNWNLKNLIVDWKEARKVHEDDSEVQLKLRNKDGAKLELDRHIQQMDRYEGEKQNQLNDVSGKEEALETQASWGIEDPSQLIQIIICVLFFIVIHFFMIELQKDLVMGTNRFGLYDKCGQVTLLVLIVLVDIIALCWYYQDEVENTIGQYLTYNTLICLLLFICFVLIVVDYLV